MCSKYFNLRLFIEFAVSDRNSVSEKISFAVLKDIFFF